MLNPEFWIMLLFALGFVISCLGIIHTVLHWGEDSDLEER